jgi:ATP-binding cassette, subfamily B, multidrug efflux pump
VGERGVTLSGGQKQRVAIARAIIKSPEILLLDDCLSAVDTKTEANILSSFKTLFKDKTAIIISHRISSVIGADNIIVLDDGEIIETGNHKTLFATDGKYAELYNKQMREEVETIGQ